MRIAFYLLIWITFFGESIYAQTHREWSKDKVMYELNVRQYSQQGTFQAVIDDLDRIDSLGVGIIWFMPIHPIGQQNRLGNLGSYYSIRDFREVNPNFGTKEDFKALVDSLHNRGIYVLMDWVANHTSWDNVLTLSHPEWYTTQNGQFISPPGTNWSDVIQLNHAKQGLKDYMVEAMRYWVDEFGIDGYRFDAVSFVPDNFWLDVLPKVRESRSDLFFLAEGHDAKYTKELGFDASFSWPFYGFNGGILSDIVSGSARVPQLATFLSNEISTFGLEGYRLYFTSNHDENSWSGTTNELFGPYAESFAVLSWMMPGMPLIYNGQEAGLNKRLAFFEKDQIPWRDHSNYDLYSTLIDLKKSNRALWTSVEGLSFRRILTDQQNEIFALYRTDTQEHRIIYILNISTDNREFKLSGDFFHGTFQDVFSGASVEINASTVFELDAYSFTLLEDKGLLTSMHETDIPKQSALISIYPNPFNPITTIRYQLSGASNVKLKVFNMYGQLVQQWAQKHVSAGEYTQLFDASTLPSGIYFVQIETDSEKLLQKMTLLK